MGIAYRNINLYFWGNSVLPATWWPHSVGGWKKMWSPLVLLTSIYPQATRADKRRSQEVQKTSAGSLYLSVGYYRRTSFRSIRSGWRSLILSDKCIYMVSRILGYLRAICFHYERRKCTPVLSFRTSKMSDLQDAGILQQFLWLLRTIQKATELNK